MGWDGIRWDGMGWDEMTWQLLSQGFPFGRKGLSTKLANKEAREKVAFQTRRGGRGKPSRIVSLIEKKNIKWRQLLQSYKQQIHLR